MRCGAPRLHARKADVPVLEGSAGPVSEAEAAAYLDKLGGGGAIMIKAVAGGGGRGMRVVSTAADLPAERDCAA